MSWRDEPVVIVGAGGQLGNALAAMLPAAVALTRSEVDLTQPSNVQATMDRLQPKTIFNCAAYNAVDLAEEEEDLASQVNGHAVGQMAKWAATHGSRFVTYSTDYVFDGNGTAPYLEDHHVSPQSAYGRSKALGERLALQQPGSLVIRTSWVISKTHPNFVATMLRLARAGRTWKVVDDQVGSPTIATDLALGTCAALDRSLTGLLHLSNRGATTWYELARASLMLADLDPDEMAPCTTAEYPTAARRPSYSVLGTSRGDEAPELPHWSDSLTDVVAGLLATSHV